ncbi:barstar family protein [Nocardia nova SH22a]|uniref:Barstar family protein n=1 Tax=Nocardia nova SH22a TaxID=1415166 RepID=W5T9X8_9NOCA|nr:barstar family protein [Nocardia nova]AHH15909.1 barstar family protein [Nocardia nova SH22a]
MASSLTLARFLAAPDPAAAGPGAARPVLGTLDLAAGPFSGVRARVPSGYVARELRAAKMRTAAGLLDEFAAAFQFPYYFGDNRDAFDECLRDLDEFVGAAPGYVAVVRDSADLLADQREDLEWFDAAMNDAADYWARRAVAFRVVLQHRPAALKPVELTL